MNEIKRQYQLSPQTNVFWRGHCVNGRMILPLDNYLMMIFKAVSFSKEGYLTLANIRLSRPLVADADDYQVNLELYCNEQGQCTINLIHPDKSYELLMSCQLALSNQLLIPSLLPDYSAAIQQGDFAGSEKHNLGKEYHLSSAYHKGNDQLTAKISSTAKATAIMASLLHGPMHCHDTNLDSNSTPELPEFIDKLTLSIDCFSNAHVLCAKHAVSEIFDHQGKCLARLEGLNWHKQKKQQTDQDIAIIGVAGQFPKAENISEFWLNLCNCIDAISACEERGNLKFSQLFKAGWLSNLFDFDPVHFNLTETEANAMDPQQRLFLAVVDDCLQDANYDKQRLTKEHVGVYVGASKSNYKKHASDNVPPQSFWGNAPSVIAGRIAYHYDFHGPAIVYDTACSSSLVSVHYAAQSIRDGTCSVAIAGGVFTMLDDTFIMEAQHASMLSPDHACQAFSDRANGFIPGEAAACILLKSYQQALVDGDKIYASLSASALNQDGMSNGITAPNGEAQSKLISQLYKGNGIDFTAVAAIEAHGTGTHLGDPLEVHALCEAFGDNLSTGSIALGSVKSNIGHTVHAAGISGLIKMVLAAYTHQIPPTLHCKPYNSQIDFTKMPFKPVEKLLNWPNDKPYAGISSFGFSGTNAHVIIKQVHKKPQQLVQTPSSQRKKYCYWKEPNVVNIKNTSNFFVDHKVKSQAILPAMASLAIAEHYLARLPSHLVNIQWPKPLLKTNDAEQTIYPYSSGEQIYLESHNREQFFLANKSQMLKQQPDLSHYPNGHLKNIVSVSQFYQCFDNHGISYGKSLQKISHLSYDQNFAVAEALILDSVSPWNINPYVLDCALQTIACFTLLQGEALSVPTQAEDILIYQPVTTGNYRFASYQRDRLCFDIAVWNEQDQLCIYIKGLKATVISQQKSSSKESSLKKKNFDDVLSLIYSIFAKQLETSLTRLHEVESFSELGIDSLMSMDIILDLEDHFGGLAETLLIDYTTFQSLAEYLAGVDVVPIEHDKPALVERNNTVEDNNDIAIIGIAVHLPKASNLKELANILINGNDCITYDANWSYPYAARLEDADQFDALFFKIAPKDALIMSPQERVMLQNAWHCFEAAGICVDGDPKAVSVYIGAMNNDYQLNGFEQTIDESKPVLANSTSASIANRISSVFNLTGASVSLDTMCSSSLTAVDMACNALRQGKVEMALVGGVNLITHNYKYQELLHRNMLSQQGYCDVFGSNADGYVPSEGVVSILLKPLKTAECDNNFIHAIIKGTATNHNGRTSGYTVPHASTQAKVIEEALKDSALQASQISYLECHGTGTRLGDPVEINGLKQIFCNDSPLFIGSLKSNYGHLEAAAGIAGIVKVVLQMQMKQLFPSIHAESLNPEIKLMQGMKINKKLQPWMQDKAGKLYAGISSFGAGGSNAHVVLSNYQEMTSEQAIPGPYLFIFSAKTKEALIRNLKEINQWLGNEHNINPYQLAYTLAITRKHHQERTAIIADSVEALRKSLSLILTGEPLQSSSHRELMDLYHQYLDGKVCDFKKIYQERVTIIANLPGYQFEPRIFQLKRKAEPGSKELFYSTTVYENSDRIELTSDCTQLIVLADLQGQKRCEQWGIDKENIYLLSDGECWQNLLGNKIDISKLNLTSETCLIFCFFDSYEWQQYLAIIQRFIVDKRAKRIIQLIALSKNIHDQLGAYYLQCQTILQYGLKSATIEIDNSSEFNINLLKAEINALENYQAIRYENNDRLIRNQKRLSQFEDSGIQVDPQKLHIITGGTSGLGADCAEWLVSKGAKSLILTGRTNLPQEELWEQFANSHSENKTSKIIKLIQKLREKGCKVYYYLIPLDDTDHFECWLKMVFAQGYQIGYVLHCAGITPNKISNNNQLNMQCLSEMLMTKLYACQRLLSFLEQFGYEKCVLFSSVSSIYPSLASGLMEYGMANVALNAIASQYKDGKVISMIWPAWQKNSRNIENNKHYQRLGIGVLSNDLGMTALSTVLNNKNIPPLLLPSKNESLKEHYEETQTGYSGQDLMPKLKEILVDVIGLTETELDPSTSFEMYGVDSVLLVDILKRLESLLNKDLSPDLLLKNNSLQKLFNALVGDYSIPQLITSSQGLMTQKNREKIAIVGMACNFPGAENLSAYWKLISNRNISIGTIPESRIDNHAFSKVKGGFISILEQPVHRFGFTRQQWDKLHPLNKLSLTLASQVLEDAGFCKSDIKGKNIGVYVGSRVPDNNPNAVVDGFSMIGRGQNFVAAHINHYYDLKGPSELVDTACSSSLVALKHAMSDLQEGDIDMAIVIGCDFIENTKPFAYMQEAGALSSNGKCLPFDVRADGIVLGEGGGAILLKPLAAANTDKNKIYSTIESIAINNDGNTMGFTTPNPSLQTDVILRAIQKAKLKASDLSYVEMHATGTELGDPIELQALNHVFVDKNSNKKCCIGSIKANIGHCLSAAGMAGLIKTVLCGYHKLLVAQPVGLQLSSRYRFDDSTLTLLKENQDLGEGPNYFGVSAFGFGGTNAHVIITDQFNTPIKPEIVTHKKTSDAMSEFFAIEAL